MSGEWVVWEPVRRCETGREPMCRRERSEIAAFDGGDEALAFARAEGCRAGGWFRTVYLDDPDGLTVGRWRIATMGPNPKGRGTPTRLPEPDVTEEIDMAGVAA